MKFLKADYLGENEVSSNVLANMIDNVKKELSEKEIKMR
jgi:hypothetical protein